MGQAVVDVVVDQDALGRRHRAFHRRELAGDVEPDDVGARRQELAELDVGGPEPLERARQTAQPLAEAFGLEVAVDERLIEAGKVKPLTDEDRRILAAAVNTLAEDLATLRGRVGLE